MKKLLASILALGLFLAFVPVADAAVWVNGYYRSDGTYVNGHYRSNPDSSPYNNWSYPGNTNPYTGVTAGGSTSSYLNNYYYSGSTRYLRPTSYRGTSSLNRYHNSTLNSLNNSPYYRSYNLYRYSSPVDYSTQSATDTLAGLR